MLATWRSPIAVCFCRIQLIKQTVLVFPFRAKHREKWRGCFSSGLMSLSHNGIQCVDQFQFCTQMALTQRSSTWPFDAECQMFHSASKAIRLAFWQTISNLLAQSQKEQVNFRIISSPCCFHSSLCAVSVVNFCIVCPQNSAKTMKFVV